MSWFNINVNESLTTLKGQISNVSNVVHDVFTEGILEEPTTTNTIGDTTTKATSDDEILIGLEEANKKIDELSAQCETKDNEVSIFAILYHILFYVCFYLFHCKPAQSIYYNTI